MSEAESNFRPDLAELLAGDALGDLDTIEREQLAEPLDEEERRLADQLQLAAAALQLSFATYELEPMPVALRSRIALEATMHQSPPKSTVHVQPLVGSLRTNPPSLRERVAWLVSAACIIFAVGVWAANRKASVDLAVNIVQARAELISQASDAIRIDWTNGTSPFDAVVEGDVVWSNSKQEGFLRFVGMPINDPAVEQYQLWIIDPKRDDKPIDGGVFDINSDGEVVIPIDAKLAVIGPAAFAVTIEKPGGVVVSDQKRLPLLAKVADAKG